MKIPLLLLLAVSLSGCGWFDRKVTANITGYSTSCIEGVRYLQFASGATVWVRPPSRVSSVLTSRMSVLLPDPFAPRIP